MEKKKNIIVIILVIIIAILSGIIGFLLGVKNDDNNSLNTEEITESKQNDMDINEATKLVSKYITGLPGASILDQGLTQDVMMESTLTGYLEQDISKYSCSNFNTNDNGYITIDRVGDSYQCTDYAKAYDYDKLNEIYKQYYGNDKEMPKRNFTIYGSLYIYAYIPKENVFVNVINGFGPGSLLRYGIKKIENNSNSLNILVSYDNITFDIEGGNTPSFDQSISFTYEELMKENFGQELVDKYGNKMKDVEFVFEKENDNYILKSVNKK